MNGNAQQSITDGQATGLPYKSERFQPKLRKNRKIELRWGSQYYDAVNKAVFANQYAPYMPSEPPQSIKEDIDKTGYVCKQCRDCFRFLSSIEDHTARKSWILGYWCQQCIVTICVHKPKGQGMCSTCLNIQASKTDYLLSKGIKKYMKKGVTRVFYNQCQFFAHLRTHGTTIVDSSEVMLMPIPSGIQREQYGQLDRVFKALMELMFIKGIHIMDWLRDKKISWNTILTPDSTKNNAIVDIVNRYSDNCLPHNPNRYENIRQDNPIQFEDSQRWLAQRRANAYSGRFKKRALSESREDKNEEQRMQSNDIAFVDCGPTPNNCVVEFPGTSSPRSETKEEDLVKSGSANLLTEKDAALWRRPASRANCLWRSFARQVDKNSCDNAAKSIEDQTEFSSSTTPINPAGPRVLTIRSPKSLSLSTIIKQLPSDGASRKKIVVVGNKCEGGKSFAAVPENPVKTDPLVASISTKSKELPALLKDGTAINDKKKFSVNSTIENSSVDDSADGKIIQPVISANLLTQTFSEQMTLHGRIVFQNGRKYIIRHVPKSKYRSILPDTDVRSPSVQTNSALPVVRPVAKCFSKHVAKSISKPVAKPAALTKINPVSKSVPILPKNVTRPTKFVKLLPKIAPRARFAVTNRNNNSDESNSRSRITANQKSLLVKFRDFMLKELHHVSKRELDKYIEHLKGINEEYSKATGFRDDSVLSINAKAIECFEKIASSVPSSNNVNEDRVDINSHDVFEKSTKEWEVGMKDSEKNRSCDVCGKIVKPATYIIGMSGPADDESLFCHCYNTVCYLCNSNQGSTLQLTIHIKWHKGEKPFTCPECLIVFPSALELEIHVWTSCFHPMSRYMYGCGVCEVEGIMDMEAIAKHFLLIHTRRKIICSECKMEYSGNNPTHTDFTKHFVEHHPDIKSISEPKRLLVCNVKQCIIRPELFRAHLSDHVGVLKWIYYKCPFCSMATQEAVRNKTMIREHLIENHLDRIHEIVSAESLPRIIEGIKRTPKSGGIILQQIDSTGSSEDVNACPPVLNVDTSGPMIINARTITPASFEHGSETSEELIEYEEAIFPKILEVRSEAAVEEFENEETPGGNDFTLQIIAVESMRDNPSESPTIDNEISNAILQESTYDESISLSDDISESVSMEICSLPINSGEECLNANEVSKSTENATSRISGSEDKKHLFKTSAELEKSKAIAKFKTKRLKAAIVKKKRLLKKPWRIALNSPSGTEAPPVAYNCHLCGELINTCWSVIKNHFSSRHSRDYRVSVVSPQIPRISPDRVEICCKEENSSVPKRKMEVAQANSAPKRRRRWGPKKHFDRPGSPSLGLCVRPEPVQEVEGSFRCKKCDELLKDRAALRDHIASNHRIKGQYLICLECGENFVVVPSLQMHLKALHGIQDPITYLSQNTAYAPDTLDDAEELEKATESNQCYVCMAVFEDKAAVDKHIRVHGMAFLKRKKFEAQKALKTSEKKGEPPDRKDEPVNNVPSSNTKPSNIVQDHNSVPKDTPPATLATTGAS